MFPKGSMSPADTRLSVRRLCHRCSIDVGQSTVKFMGGDRSGNEQTDNWLHRWRAQVQSLARCESQPPSSWLDKPICHLILQLVVPSIAIERKMNALSSLWSFRRARRGSITWVKKYFLSHIPDPLTLRTSAPISIGIALKTNLHTLVPWSVRRKEMYPTKLSISLVIR